MFSFLNNEPLSCAYPNIKETIPASQLGYGTNNRFPSFPPLMQDGRAVISAWQPEAVINQRILTQNNIQSNWKYRQFINLHAKEILENNFQEACNDTGYTVPLQGQVHPPTPYIYHSNEDKTTVLGVQNTDLKDLYLSREELEARKIAPSLTQAELIQRFGIRP